MLSLQNKGFFDHCSVWDLRWLAISGPWLAISVLLAFQIRRFQARGVIVSSFAGLGKFCAAMIRIRAVLAELGHSPDQTGHYENPVARDHAGGAFRLHL
jgi:hypothetical protein